MEPIMDNGVQTLSGGELQRCAIVLCLGTAADIYLVRTILHCRKCTSYSFPFFFIVIIVIHVIIIIIISYYFLSCPNLLDAF